MSETVCLDNFAFSLTGTRWFLIFFVALMVGEHQERNTARMMTNPHCVCLRNANSLICADISCWLSLNGTSSFYCFGIEQMENLFILLVVFFPTYNMDKNKFMQQDSAHNQGLCIKGIYKMRLS